MSKYGERKDILDNVVINEKNVGYIEKIFDYPEYGHPLFDNGIKYQPNSDLNEEDFKPLLELVDKLADINKNIIFTMVNSKYKPKILKRVAEFKRLGITNFVVICMDQKLFDDLAEIGLKEHIFCYPINLNKKITGVPQNILRFVHLQKRHYIVYYFLKNGFNVLSYDADACWLRNPFEIFNKHRDIQMFIVQEYTKFPTKIFNDIKYVVRGGFFFVKSHPTTTTLFYNSYKIARMFVCAQYSLTTLMYLGGNIRVPKDISYTVYMHRMGEHRVSLTDEEFITNFEDITILILPHKLFPRFEMADKDDKPCVPDPLPMLQIKYYAVDGNYTIFGKNTQRPKDSETSYLNNLL